MDPKIWLEPRGRVPGVETRAVAWSERTPVMGIEPQSIWCQCCWFRYLLCRSWEPMAQMAATFDAKLRCGRAPGSSDRSQAGKSVRCRVGPCHETSGE